MWRIKHDLSSFTNVPELTVAASCLSVCLSALVEHRRSQSSDFHENLLMDIFSKFVQKTVLLFKPEQSAPHLTWTRHTIYHNFLNPTWNDQISR